MNLKIDYNQEHDEYRIGHTIMSIILISLTLIIIWNSIEMVNLKTVERQYYEDCDCDYFCNKTTPILEYNPDVYRNQRETNKLYLNRSIF